MSYLLCFHRQISPSAIARGFSESKDGPPSISLSLKLILLQ